MAAKNIWIDDAFPYSGQTLHYCVKRNGTKIYEGEATARDFSIKIYLNRIAQDFLESTFPTETGVTADPGAGAAFSLVEMTREGSDWVEGDVLYCAVYIDAWGGENGQTMAQPINGHADMRQRLFYTSYKDIDCLTFTGDTGYAYEETTGTTTGNSISVSYISTSLCTWKKINLSEHMADLMGIAPVNPRHPYVNYYMWYNNEYYWVYNNRRVVGQGYIQNQSPAYPTVYPTVYKCT